MLHKIKSNYKCPYCSKCYTRKFYYNKHVEVCKIIINNTKTARERILEQQETTDTPTIRELYELVMYLSQRLTNFENSLNKVKQWTETRKRNLNIIDWLNNNYSITLDFHTWKDNININRVHLDTIFQHGHIQGIIYLFHEFLPLNNEANLPIKAFDQKDNTLFIYEDAQWRVLTITELEALIQVIAKKILNEFVIWQNETKHLMTDEKFVDTYLQNARTVMGTALSKDKIITSIRRDLYKHLNLNLRNIIQYEFSF